MTDPSDIHKKKACRYCDTELGEAFLDLGAHPLANNLVHKKDSDKKEFQCPLQLVKCSECHLVQLTHVVPPELMFADYLYVSSTTKTFLNHFAEYAKDVKNRLIKKEGAVALDIGSNDGLLVSCYTKEGMRGVGVDPAKNLSDEANKKGITTINEFFDKSCVEEIISKYGRADVISGNNVFAHIDDIQSVCRNVYDLLDDNGFFVIEFPYLVTMLEKMFFDMIYHEHVSYISVNSLTYLLARFNLKIFDIKEVPSHGGSLRIFIQKKNGPYNTEEIVERLMASEEENGFLGGHVYDEFAKQVLKFRTEFNRIIDRLKADKKNIVGYGAPAKATTIINFCGLNTEQIDFIVDDNPLKQDRLVPGSKIPIFASTRLQNSQPDYVIIFAWNFAKEIISKIDHLKEKGVSFIIPLPKPTIV